MSLCVIICILHDKTLMSINMREVLATVDKFHLRSGVKLSAADKQCLMSPVIVAVK